MLHVSAVRRLPWTIACTALLAIVGTTDAQAQPAPQRVPVAPPADSDDDGEVEPGFEDEVPADEAEAEVARKRKRRSKKVRVVEEADIDDPGSNERLIEQINATRGEIGLTELVDEILADVMAELDRLPPVLVSPIAIREIRLGSNVRPSYRVKLESQLLAALYSGTELEVLECIECKATRTRIQDGKWIVTRGLVTTEDMRAAAERIGCKSFLDVEFAFDPQDSQVEMTFKLVRARDAQVIWSELFAANDTTPMLLRSSRAPMRRKERLRDLEMLLEGRPFYGHMAYAGFMLIPYDDPIQGDISGASAGYRVYERFGEERRVMFGLDISGFFNPERLSGGLLSAGSWWIPIRPDLVNPELRIGAKAGAFIAGTEGNAAVFQLGAEVLLRYRFGLYAYVLFMTKSPYTGNGNGGENLGGVGMSAGMSFNW